MQLHLRYVSLEELMLWLGLNGDIIICLREENMQQMAAAKRQIISLQAGSLRMSILRRATRKLKKQNVIVFKMRGNKVNLDAYAHIYLDVQ